MKSQIIYYTCNSHLEEIDELCRTQLLRSGVPIVSVSLNKPIDFGDTRLVMTGTRGALMMHRQILAGLEAATADTVFLCESDVLYHFSHFAVEPKRTDTYYYNTNVWRLRWADRIAVWTDDLQQVSGICASRDLLLNFYTQRLAQIKTEGFNRHYEPGVKQSVGSRLVENWQSEYPNICIRHDNNLTASKWHPSEFRNKRYAAGWKISNYVKGWEHIPDLFTKAAV